MYLHNIIFIIPPSAVGQSNAVAVTVAPQNSPSNGGGGAHGYSPQTVGHTPPPHGVTRLGRRSRMGRQKLENPSPRR